MQFSLKTVAFTLALVASSTAAFASSVPIGTAPSQPGTLTLALFNEGGNTTTLVNLTQTVGALSTPGAGGAFSPDAAIGNFTQVTDPTSAAKQVLQIDYGNIPLDASLTGNVRYMVIGAQGSTSIITNNLGGQLAQSSVANSTINTIVANWGLSNLTGGVSTDTTGSANWSLKANANGQPYVSLGSSGGDFSAAIGTAASMYYYTSGRGAAATQFANSTGAGFWFLSNTGNLTWNVPVAGTAPVPLPAAAWLLMSGLAGLGTVGRRRKAA